MSRKSIVRTSAAESATTGTSAWMRPRIQARGHAGDTAHEAPRIVHDFRRIAIRDATPGVIQPKHTLGSPNDRYEQEADQTADRIVAMGEGVAPTGIIQRACAACQQEDDATQQTVQRSVQQKKRSNTAHAMLDEGALASMRRGGRPMADADRQYFEPRFGVDLSGVRIHADRRAATLASSISARAFTIGRDVVFGHGEYSPSTLTGKRLFAHELTHVLQQTGGVAHRAPITPSAPPGTETRAGARRAGSASREAIRSVPSSAGVMVQAKSDGETELGVFSSSMCPNKVTYLGQRQEGDDSAYKAYFEVKAGTKACKVYVHFDDPHDEDATKEADRMFNLLLRASSGKIKVCVVFDARLADPNCEDPREVEDVTVV